MNVLTTFSYAGSKIAFASEGGVRVNATQMAKPFWKRPVDWLKTQPSQDFITALSEVKKITSADLVKVIKGGNGEQGTWMHEDVALEFARWLSPKFAIWCNDRIKELLTAQQQPEKGEVLPPIDKCAVFFADSEEMCKFAAFTREGHSFKASPENINGIKSAEVSCVSNGAHLNGVSSLVNSTHPRTFLFMFTRENQVCLYNGSPVTFKLGDGTTTVNATQMAKPFGKLVADWQRQKSTREFLKALSNDMGIHISALIQTVRGGNGEQGTWMHEDVALEFARWLSPKFAIWCNRRIKELLTAQQQPEKGEVLPPPIDNSLPNNALVETINGKAVTTSRKLASVLGREHSDVLRTIRNNLGNRRLHHYQFTSRDYRTDASGRSYEFLITRKGLDALAGVMRYGAKDKIKEAYKGAWQSRGTAVVPVLPMPEPLEAEEEMPEPGVTALPMLPMPEDIEEATKPAQAETASDESDEEIVYTPKQQKYIDWLEGYNEVLVDRLNKTKAAKELYADLYENEKKRRLRNGEAMGYWHDLYEDLMFRLLGKDDSPLAEKMEAHATFRKRISKG